MAESHGNGKLVHHYKGRKESVSTKINRINKRKEIISHDIFLISEVLSQVFDVWMLSLEIHD